MENILIGLILGVAGSLIATLLWVYLFDPIKYSLAYSFTPISGTYESSYPDNEEWPSESIEIKQLGFHIRGELVDSETKEKYLVTGKIASRIVIYLVRPKNRRLNEFSAGLVKLSQDGKSAAGYVVYLTEDKELPAPVKVQLKYVDEKVKVSACKQETQEGVT